MELKNDLLPPLPKGDSILPQDAKMETNIDIGVSPGSNLVLENIHKKVNMEIANNQEKIQKILIKHGKVPVWKSSEQKVAVQCNFQHEYQLSVSEIMKHNVRCPQCRVHIDTIAQKIYASDKNSTGIDPKMFKIVRINKYGQVVLRCLANDHKIRITYNTQLTDSIKSFPEYCPECVVDINSPSSKYTKVSKNDLSGKSQSLNIYEGSDEGDSDWDEYFKYDSFLHHGGDEDLFDSDGEIPMGANHCESLDFGILDIPDRHSESDSDSEQHKPQSCCDSNEYDDYFDNISLSEPESSLEEQVKEELEDSQVNQIISTVVSRFHETYAAQKEIALEKYRKKVKL